MLRVEVGARALRNQTGGRGGWGERVQRPVVVLAQVCVSGPQNRKRLQEGINSPSELSRSLPAKGPSKLINSGLNLPPGEIRELELSALKCEVGATQHADALSRLDFIPPSRIAHYISANSSLRISPGCRFVQKSVCCGLFSKSQSIIFVLLGSSATIARGITGLKDRQFGEQEGLSANGSVNRYLIGTGQYLSPRRKAGAKGESEVTTDGPEPLFGEAGPCGLGNPAT